MPGLTGRRKRPLNRTVKHLKDTSLIIIATEGECTEKAYFESNLFRSTRVQVKVLETRGGLSAPEKVFSRLKAFQREYNLNSEDQLWLVIDRDRWEDSMLSDTCRKCLKAGYKTAVSNPCFELWIYLHFQDWTHGKVSSGEMETALRELLGGYRKKNPPLERLRNKVSGAIENSKKLIGNTDYRWPENPGTHVHRLAHEILRLINENQHDL